MTYAIGAAGTGGHVFPGLSVAEALIARGVRRDDVLFVGGSRLESTVYPREGFPFLEVELRGLQRSLTTANLGIPRVVLSAVSTIAAAFDDRNVRVVLGMGGYVTIPAAWAGRRVGAKVGVSEQNAEAGLANAVVSRFADVAFGSFPTTRRMPRARWVGNPVRTALSEFDRGALRTEAIARYGLHPEVPVLGVFGGSLGAGVINGAITAMAGGWQGPALQILHLAGTQHVDKLETSAKSAALTWRVIGFEDRMDLFYAACDLIVARAGGAVAELAVTRTPAILVPGGFGSGTHQEANAAAFAEIGGALVLTEHQIHRLPSIVAELIADPQRRRVMSECLAALAKPDAAESVAAALERLHG
jgi:UDP-N-acetylglucosamine--N-acetylmuramyl-(pentapeptide) pyrophosphoryl-undecaprenol N-acetylglucosamine transferase